MTRPQLEVAEIFRRFGPAWRAANAGHLSLAQRRVMRAVELCRTAELGGHVEQCADCAHTRIAYNSCRNRHCPKCQWGAAQAWLEAREAELLPVPYFHVVFTVPAALGALAYQNKARVYGLLLKAATETLTTIAADPKHLGARIGITSVLHSWGSAMTHHPHVHMIVPGGGIALDGERWIACRPGFFLPVRALSRLFRRLFLDNLTAAHEAGHLHFFGDHTHLDDARAFAAYLARYTHRVAISNSRLIAADATSVTFRVKDYRVEGPGRYTTMTLDAGEFIRRFLLHVLPKGFHRIRHYGLLASTAKAEMVAKARELLAVPATEPAADENVAMENVQQCPCCGGRMHIIETFAPGTHPNYCAPAPVGAIRIDTS
jgi:hypothetical protein